MDKPVNQNIENIIVEIMKMLNLNSVPDDFSLDELAERYLSPVEAIANHINATQNYCVGFTKYLNQFLIPYLISTNYFRDVEQARLLNTSPADSFQSYMDLLEFNLDLSNRNLIASMKAISEYNNREVPNAMSAMFNSFFGLEGENLEGFFARQSKMIDLVTNVYPKAIRDVEPEFGFHFERGDNSIKVAETDRFILYQIFPTDKSVEIRENGKPIIILPPYVLGANILAFLPGEGKSYTHAFANQGIPTYIRVLKDIETTPALQIMTGENDALDTKYFCEKIKGRHGKPVTLNGYCQGGFSAICDYLTGELDGLVDALLTCVAPMDGTRSVGLANFLNNLPTRFNDLAYGTKTMPNGNKVADGKLMGWVYKLKSIEAESPIVAFIRDMNMLSPKNDREIKIPKTAAAINYWLEYERNDLPLSITQMSFDSYNIPITDDGTLPVKLFGNKLNFKRIKEKKIPWLICYGERDDLVEKSTALAPLDYIDAEISAFPKGHVAIATSWSNPKSACALHTIFGEDRKYRGPVRYQLDLEESLSKPKPSPRKRSGKKKDVDKPIPKTDASAKKAKGKAKNTVTS
jgi:hypothetical protein